MVLSMEINKYRMVIYHQNQMNVALVRFRTPTALVRVQNQYETILWHAFFIVWVLCL